MTNEPERLTFNSLPILTNEERCSTKDISGLFDLVSSMLMMEENNLDEIADFLEDIFDNEEDLEKFFSYASERIHNDYILEKFFDCWINSKNQ